MDSSSSRKQRKRLGSPKLVRLTIWHLNSSMIVVCIATFQISGPWDVFSMSWQLESLPLTPIPSRI